MRWTKIAIRKWARGGRCSNLNTNASGRRSALLNLSPEIFRMSLGQESKQAKHQVRWCVSTFDFALSLESQGSFIAAALLQSKGGACEAKELEEMYLIQAQP